MKTIVCFATLFLITLSGCVEKGLNLASIDSVHISSLKAGKRYVWSLDDDDTDWFRKLVKECSWQAMDSEPEVPRVSFELFNDQEFVTITGVVGSNLVLTDESALWACPLADAERVKLLSFGEH